MPHESARGRASREPARPAAPREREDPGRAERRDQDDDDAVDDQVDPAPGQGPEFGEASPLALLVIILLGIAVIFLVRSMTKHLRKIPATFDDPPENKPDQS